MSWLIAFQGMFCGIGGALLWYPSITVVPEYFTTRKALAFGISAAGKPPLHPTSTTPPEH
jgi:hypothetical protein